MKPRLAVLGSGKGSNFAAIVEAVAREKLDARIVAVISDHADAGILALAREHGVPGIYHPPGNFRTRLAEDREQALVFLLREMRADWIVLAGWMRVVKSPMLDAFPGRIVNIHPSLLPAFPGLAAWKQALDAGVKTTGCTVHLVDAGVDSGPILGQAEVPVLPEDTAETLHARIQEAERRLYPEVLQRLLNPAP